MEKMRQRRKCSKNSLRGCVGLGWTVCLVCLPVCAVTQLKGAGRAGCRVSGTFAMGGGDSTAFSRESDAEVAGYGQGVCRTGEKIKALKMISLRHATRLLRWNIKRVAVSHKYGSRRRGPTQRVEVFCTMLSSCRAKETDKTYGAEER